MFDSPVLNSFAELGRQTHRTVREYLQQVFTLDGPYPDILEKRPELQKQVIYNIKEVRNHVPMQIRDYTDFFCGLNHSYNCGVIFRGKENALQPNYFHLPVGYHGRASSIVVSGTPIRRPRGQTLADPKATVKKPVYGPTKKLDFELEFGAFISKPSAMGDPVDVSSASDYIFGFVLFNDWSARDIQAWEYVPLGPFTAKNFGSSISPWVVLYDALVPFKATPIPRDEAVHGPVQDYLAEKETHSVFDIPSEVEISTGDGQSAIVGRSSLRYLLWSFQQMVAQQTVTGCNLSTGDLLGSGTISGETTESYGSLIEMSYNGTQDVVIGGAKRRFLEDGDTVIIRAQAGNDDEGYVGFGDLVGTILPAHK